MKPYNQRSTYILFLVTVLSFGIASALFRGVLDNYLANILHVSKSGRGVVEFFRELPGLLLLLFLALFYMLPEHQILRIGYGIALFGATAFLLWGNEIVSAIIFLTFWSIGMHIIMPVRQSFAVHSVANGSEGGALGMMRGVESIGRVAGFFIIPLIFALTADAGVEESSSPAGFTVTFIGIVILVLISLILSLFLRSDGKRVRRQRLYFRRKYLTYYILQNFYGARKQVFLTFAPYVLILYYGASPSKIASLMGISAVLTIFGSPLIGRIIDKAGYKSVMVGDTVILFFVCLLYGFAHRLFPADTAYLVISIVYVVDRVVSQASIAASVYVKDLSENREEMTATLSTGISLDHLISIFIALAGGAIWEFLGIEMLFILAAMMAVMNSLIALTIKPHIHADA